MIVLRSFALAFMAIGLVCACGCGGTSDDMEPIVQTEPPPADAKAKTAKPTRGGPASGPQAGPKQPRGRRGQRPN